jgi:hypothetical protein
MDKEASGISKRIFIIVESSVEMKRQEDKRGTRERGIRA